MNKFYMLTEIGGGGVWVSEVQHFLQQNRGKDVEIIINSPGGIVADGVAMYNLLKAHDGKVITRAVGEVASIASVIFLAGSERIVETGAWLMIHKPWNIVAGDAETLRKQADVLDTLQEGVQEIYSSVFTGEAEALQGIVDAETWLLGDEAIVLGFATTVEGTITAVASSVKNNLGHFKNVPNALNRAKPVDISPEPTNAPNTAENSGPGSNPAADETNKPITEVSVMDIEQATAADVLAKNPGLYKEIQALAIKSEQDRVAGIKALATVVAGAPAHVVNAVNAKITTLCEDPTATADNSAKALLQVSAQAQNDVAQDVGAGPRALGEDLNDVPTGNEDETTTDEAKATAKINGMAAGFAKK